MRYVLVILSGLLTALFVQAQPYVDIVNLQTRYLAPVAYTSNAFPPSQLHASRFMGRIMLPIELKSKDFILAGGSFDAIHFGHRTVNSHTAHYLYGVDLQLGGVKRWNETWQTSVLAIPRFAGDFLLTDERHFQIGGAVLVDYVHSHTLKLRGGMYYNREFFGNLFVPLAGLHWKVSKRFQIFGVIPQTMTLEYKLRKHLYTGLGWQAKTASFRLSEGFPNYYVREGHRVMGHQLLWAFLDFYLWEDVVVSMGAGHNAWRQFDLYHNDNKREPLLLLPVYSPFKDGFFVQLTLAYRIRLDKEKEDPL